MKVGDLVRYAATNNKMIGVIVKLGEMIRGRYSYPWAEVVFPLGTGEHRDEVLTKDLELISESR